ncbi:hypothetical protein YC2023_117652 [Brassica napus]
MLTRDLQHCARNTVRNGSHRATQGDAVWRESSKDRMAPRFDDFVSSPFLSLFSHLVAPFIAARFSGGSFFAIFATSDFHSPSLRLFLFFSYFPWCRCAELVFGALISST